MSASVSESVLRLGRLVGTRTPAFNVIPPFSDRMTKVETVLLSAGQANTVFGEVPDCYWIQTILFLAVALAPLLFRPKAVEAA